MRYVIVYYTRTVVKLYVFLEDLIREGGGGERERERGGRQRERE